MKKRNIICLILFFLLLFGALYLYNQKLYTYLIIVVPILFILLFFSIKGIRTKYSPEDEYNMFLKEILKTYDAVLINVVEMPSVDGRSIVKVSNFEDLIDAQIEIRKPIYYKRDDRSTIFVLLDDKQVCINILKVDEEENTQFDRWLADLEKGKNKFDESILAGIENTTIVRLDNNKSYRVIPIKDNDKKTIKDSKELEKTLADLPKLKDTIELSNTQFFKDINKRINKKKK
jgi:hypothetical protein